MVSQAYADEQVKKDAQLRQLLLQQGKVLTDNGDVKLVCLKLDKGINAYLLAHQFKAAPALMKLSTAVGSAAAAYRGAMTASIWLK